MSGIFLKWGVPAFVTVIGGTAAAVTATGAAIPEDLNTRSQTAIAGPDLDWASLSFEMRDATISGVATTQRTIDEAIARVAAVHGVRSVTSKVILAEYVSPFPFMATINGSKIALAGGLPDEKARAHILEQAGTGTTDQTRLLSGAPDRTEWLQAVDYALAYASELDEGEVALGDLKLTISGRARSPAAYAALNELNGKPLPEGVELAFREIEPPLMSPFRWQAEYSDDGITLTGAVPSEELAGQLIDSVPAGIEVDANLSLASGAPPEFDSTAKLLLANLLKLENGSAEISGVASTLSGLPADPEVAQAVRVAMSPGQTTVELGTPVISEYWLSAERTADGIRLDGFVPDEAMRDRLDALDEVDGSSLELGRGAPEQFGVGVDFMIAWLRQMSDGNATIRGNVITVEGRAATASAFAAIDRTVTAGAPSGLSFASVEVQPPLVTPFIFAAEKAESGAFNLSGYLPDSATRQALLASLSGPATDTTTLADGNPADFDEVAQKAIAILPLLDSGRISFDGANWSLSGAVNSADEARAAETAFAGAGLRSAGWNYAVTLSGEEPAPPVETATLPVIDPYVWRAQKTADGSIAVSGFVPTDEAKNQLAAIAGTGAIDGTSLGGGAPDDFVPAAVAGLEALVALEEGTLTLTSGTWSLTGRVASGGTSEAVTTSLASAVDTSAWQVSIAGDEPVTPVVSPFTWAAAKSTDGKVALSGYLPTEELRQVVADLAGVGAADTSLIGSGAPQGFADDVLAAMGALMQLESGEVQFDGTAWSISGQPATAEDVDAVRAALALASDGGAGWTQSLAEPTTTPPEPEVAAAPEPTPAEIPVEPAQTPDPPADAPAAEPEPAEAEVAAIPPVEEPVAAPVVRNFVFDAKKPAGGAITFSGAIPSEPMRQYLAVIAGGRPEAGLAIRTDLPADFANSANAGSRALVRLNDGELGLDGTTWVLTGRAETAADRDAALAELTGVPGRDTWVTEIALLPPLDVCRERVDGFASRNAILFRSGSAQIAEASLPAIDELVGYLSLCPEASVSVEGHTDTDGEEDANLALSVARAEAVVDALILRGVGPERLYAVGYGEALPIASNETTKGKQANRRIAFTLSDQ